MTSGALYSEGLQYDFAGRLSVIQESVNGTPTQYTYTYDSVGRLTSATKDGTQTTSWTYDGNGNRLTEGGVTSTFDAQDRLLTTTYTWDALAPTWGAGVSATSGGSMSESFELTEFHDSRMRSAVVRGDEVVLLFDRVACYRRTSRADVFDVSAHELEIRLVGATRVDASGLVGGEHAVSDGVLLRDGLEVPFLGDSTLGGACRCELSFCGGGVLRVESRRIEIKFGAGRVVEQWVGPLS